jgi:hypothetical protein
MKKYLQIFFASAFLFGLFLTTTIGRAQSTATTVDPNGTPTATTFNVPPAPPAGTTNPISVSEPAAPSATAVTAPPVLTTPTPPLLPPTTSPSHTATPSPAASCPSVPPVSNAICPKADPPPIIPQFPSSLIVTPFLAVFIFWIIISYLNRGRIRLEKGFLTRRLAASHQQNIDQARFREYQNLLDFLTKESSSGERFHLDKYEMIAVKIQLLGSAQMQNLLGRITEAIGTNDRQSLKPLIKELSRQIKKEL